MTDKQDTITDEMLARRAAGGDRAAFDTIVGRYARPLLRFVTARTGLVQDAEDIVQETFLRSYQHIGSFDGRYPLKSWLYTIAYRVAVSSFRKKRPVAISQEAITDLADTSVERTAAASDSGLWSHVKEMKPDDHTVLCLRYQQDMDIEQIARVMNKSRSGVRVHLHRARGRLARRIETAERTAGPCALDVTNGVSMERIK